MLLTHSPITLLPCRRVAQSRTDVPFRVGRETREEHLTRRVDYAYSRTASAVFNTSFTTALAFICTGVSPLMPISAFGWFAATAIVVNYLFVVTFTPAILVISERYWYRWCARCCAKTCKGGKRCGYDLFLP